MSDCPTMRYLVPDDCMVSLACECGAESAARTAGGLVACHECGSVYRFFRPDLEVPLLRVNTGGAVSA